MKFVYYYMIVINIIGFVVMGRDKQLAKKKQWRISEASLWSVAFIGGSIGATIGMRYFRHKTRHTAFKMGLPILAAIQIALIVFLR